jgi:hypothetical protein
MRMLGNRLRLGRRAAPIYTAGLVALVALAACHPGEVSNLSETDVVLTVFDSEANFGAMTEYAMPDTVYEIQDSEAMDPQWDHDSDAVILAAVRSNMDALGYTEVDTSRIGSGNPPDLVMIVRAITAQNYLLYSWYPWYPGWGGWGGFRPWYPPVTETVPFRSGTIQMELIDVARSDTADSLLTVGWIGTLNGVAEGTTAEVEARVGAAIDRAFAQSPYLASRAR